MVINQSWTHLFGAVTNEQSPCLPKLCLTRQSQGGPPATFSVHLGKATYETWSAQVWRVGQEWVACNQGERLASFSQLPGCCDRNESQILTLGFEKIISHVSFSYPLPKSR